MRSVCRGRLLDQVGKDPPTPQQHPISGPTDKHVLLGEKAEMNLTGNRSICWLASFLGAVYHGGDGGGG